MYKIAEEQQSTFTRLTLHHIECLFSSDIDLFFYSKISLPSTCSYTISIMLINCVVQEMGWEHDNRQTPGWPGDVCNLEMSKAKQIHGDSKRTGHVYCSTGFSNFFLGGEGVKWRQRTILNPFSYHASIFWRLIVKYFSTTSHHSICQVYIYYIA